MGITLHDKISESATTSVYRAYDESLGRDVLLKVLHRHLAHDEPVRQRFMREARACAALHSEYIVQVFDLRDHEGSPAIVMEYVEGRSLKDVIADGNTRTFPFARKVAVHVLSGLAEAHSRGIIHRDIKPGNILVSSSGTIKIADFGLAQVAVAPALTSEGMVVGTPAYFAPEVIQGQPADPRSDLFSLGATLVETLTGDRLFEGDTYSECLNRISLFKTDSLDHLAAASSPEFVAFLKRLMDPDRSRRFSTPAEALAALGQKSASHTGFLIPEKSRPGRGVVRRAGLLLVPAALLAGVVFLVRMSTNPPGPATNNALAGQDSSSGTVAETAGSGNAAEHGRREPPAAGTSGAHPDSVAAIPDQEFGTLSIAGNRGAGVRIDDQPVGELPLEHPLRVQPGSHTVVLTLAPYEPFVQVVRVDPGRDVTVNAEFRQSTGYLRCLAKPWAEIYIDDLYRDMTPIDRPIAVSGGTHRVRFHNPSFRDSVLDVSVLPRDTVELKVTFRP